MDSEDVFIVIHKLSLERLRYAGYENPEETTARDACVWIKSGSGPVWHSFYPDDIKNLLKDLESLRPDPEMRTEPVGSVLLTSRREYRAEIMIKRDKERARCFPLAEWWLTTANKVGLAKRINVARAEIGTGNAKFVWPDHVVMGHDNIFFFLENYPPDYLRPYTIVRPPG